MGARLAWSKMSAFAVRWSGVAYHHQMPIIATIRASPTRTKRVLDFDLRLSAETIASRSGVPERAFLLFLNGDQPLVSLPLFTPVETSRTVTLLPHRLQVKVCPPNRFET